LSHGELKQWNTSVAFSNTFQACHAVFLPFPTNADTVSQPVNASKKGNAFDLGPSDQTIS
jgi:hypothetical protein